MLTLPELLKEAALLADEEKAGLAAHLLASLPVSESEQQGDEEVAKREEEMDSGEVTPISHAEFLRQVGR